MNLRGIANKVTQVVNPNITVGVQASSGYTIGSGAKQVPTYAPSVDGPGQLQAMSYSNLQQTSNLNIQGVIKTLYLYGSLSGVVRPDTKGGDLVTISAQPGVGAQDIGTWLVVKVLENWPQWTKVAIVKQGGV